MPTYLDFDSTKNFRDFVLSKTLKQPNGPQTQTKDSYAVNSLSTFSNVDPGTVENLRDENLLKTQNGNIYKPFEYSVKENFDTIPRRANLSLYPYFVSTDHNLISIFNTESFENESELFKFAAENIKSNPRGPILSRLQQNLEASTIGRVRLFDALKGNTAAALNILTGREPLVEKNNKITVAKTILGKGVDFLQTVAGVEFPFTEIPGDYLTNPANPVIFRPTATTTAGAILQDVTGVLGSIIGVSRRPKLTAKPSDLLIDYMGEGQKQKLYDNLSYSKYRPNYTTTARSQQSSKLFNFPGAFGQGIKNILGLEAPNGFAYIGDDRGNDVKFAMNDLSGNVVKSNYYLSLLFDPIQATLFQNKRNITEGGSIGGKLTWISKNSRNKLGENNSEYNSESSLFIPTLSTSTTFREDSILGRTQEILDSMPTDAGAARSHIANVIDQTSRIFREGDVMLSRGSAIKYTDKFSGAETGIEYCRAWTKDRSYMNYSDTMKRTSLIRKYDGSVLLTPYDLSIAPTTNGKRSDPQGGEFYAKKYMFSIENLAWKSSNKPNYTVQDLPYSERGPNGGRIMWFPPYDLKINENNSAKWEENVFIGRPEPVYTYQNTSRTGTLSFKIVVDHPSILNLLIQEHFKGMTDEESTNYINAFFAGCEELDFYDLIKRYTMLDNEDVSLIKAYLNNGKNPDTVKNYRVSEVIGEPVKSQPNTDPSQSKKNSTDTKLTTDFYFGNDFPKPKSPNEGELYSDNSLENEIQRYTNGSGTYITQLTQGLNEIQNSDLYKSDREFVYGNKKTTNDINLQVNQVSALFNENYSNYTNVYNRLVEIKDKLKNDEIQNIDLFISSSTSYLAGDDYNLKLSYRRTHSIIKFILEKLTKDGTTAPEFKFKEDLNKVKSLGKEDGSGVVSVKLKDLGWNTGELKIIYRNYGENTSANIGSEGGSGCICKKGSLKNNILKTTALKTFLCRHSKVGLSYTLKDKVSPNKNDENIPLRKIDLKVEEYETTIKRKPSIDPLKKIIMKTLSESYYFKKLEEDSPVAFTSLKEKLRYFHPGFHSMTPEGLNGRLNFLLQCIRPGDTIPIKGVIEDSNLNARNTTFGPPPICVLRIGDFYNSKVIVRDCNFTYDDTTWDLNPEGIGVQPMLVTVQLQIAFIGGQGIKNPIDKLQNALSSNFFANTEVYDYRSETTNETIGGQKTEIFSKKFLEELQKKSEKRPRNNATQEESIDNIPRGVYIGKISGSDLFYDSVVKNLFSSTKNYFETYSLTYQSIQNKFGPELSSLLLSPNYRTINKYAVQNTPTTTIEINLFGASPINDDIITQTNSLEQLLIQKIDSTNIGQVVFDFDLTDVQKTKSELYLNSYFKKMVNNLITDLTSQDGVGKIDEKQKEIIKNLDKLNFIMKANGYDCKITEKTNEVTGSTFNGFNYVDFYNSYSKSVDFIKEKQKLFTENLNQQYDFRNLTITDSLFKSIFCVYLNDKKEEIKKLYVDTIIFNKTVMDKIDKKLTKNLVKLSTKPIEIKKIPTEKEDLSSLKYTISGPYTPSSETIEDFKKTIGIKNKLGLTLNYYR